MTRSLKLDRRQVGAGLLAATALAATGGGRGAAPWAQEAAGSSAGTGAWRELGSLTLEAQKLGLATPSLSLGAEALGGGFDALMPAVIDFMDNIEASAAEAPAAAPADVDSLLERASDILRKARAEERSPRDIGAEEVPGAAPKVVAPKFEDIVAEYRALFASCTIKEDRRSEVQWCVSKIIEEKRRKSYEKVYEITCVPWHFVAITHGMEASFDLLAHLHNGDPLKSKTVQIPRNRPDPWNPPSDWASSAVDAMQVDKFADQTDWDLAKLLYRWEAYNGWRSRVLYKIHTPYLWSYTNHYIKGKFVRDNVWDPNAVSKQCGTAAMLKALVESGAIAPPA